jgi:hypothetical protein
MNFHVFSPLPAKICLYQNGEKLMETEGTEAVFRVNRTGPVRVELFRDGKGWIYSNHIYVMHPRFKDFSPKSKALGAPSSSEKERVHAKPETESANDKKVRPDKIHQGKKPFRQAQPPRNKESEKASPASEKPTQRYARQRNSNQPRTVNSEGN